MRGEALARLPGSLTAQLGLSRWLRPPRSNVALAPFLEVAFDCHWPRHLACGLWKSGGKCQRPLSCRLRTRRRRTVTDDILAVTTLSGHPAPRKADSKLNYGGGDLLPIVFSLIARSVAALAAASSRSLACLFASNSNGGRSRLADPSAARVVARPSKHFCRKFSIPIGGLAFNDRSSAST